ncbi:uncharacterized protein [Rutidosis leptorrhynchoides]|uniref:uncharacterized protein n=1 Tax=Rutidosis leptorrhynchoides TaxID=125765 RepID=UPI003A99D189
MVMATRSGDEALESIRATIAEMNQTMIDMNARTNERIDAVLLEHQYFTNELHQFRNGDRQGNRGNQQLTRLTGLEFPKFEGSDVKGWLYRCNQFFTVDHVEEHKKVRIASIHMYDKALTWHQQFVRINGEHIGWAVYEDALLKRFGTTVEDPLNGNGSSLL